MNKFQKINEIIYNFKIDKKFWYYDDLTGEDYDIRRSKPGPYIKKTIEIANLLNLKTVVEIGSSRLAISQKCINYFDNEPIDAFTSPPCCCDGHSTFYWTRAGFETHSVDIDENCLNSIKFSYENIGSTQPNNLFIHIPQDGIHFLNTFDKQIDILYLDGWDKGTDNYAHNHLIAFAFAKPKLSDIHLILIDDTDYITSDGGKDKLLSPFLIQNNYIPLFNGRQTLFINRIPYE